MQYFQTQISLGVIIIVLHHYTALADLPLLFRLIKNETTRLTEYTGLANRQADSILTENKCYLQN